MEGIQKTLQKISKDAKNGTSSSSSIAAEPPPPSSTFVSSSGILMTRPTRQMVSLWTCSKLCAVFFVAGVVVGYTLKQQVRRLAAKLLRRLKDD
ncbi:hypothetical protein Ancab_017873 [Ancistrocladus abbreviatus]